MSDLANLHREAQSMRTRSARENWSITLREFDEYIFAPLCDLVRREHDRQLADIRENGT